MLPVAAVARAGSLVTRSPLLLQRGMRQQLVASSLVPAAQMASLYVRTLCIHVVCSGDVLGASKAILLDVLQADLHICGAPCLPADLKTTDKTVLKGPLVLQVDEWVDIGPGASNTSDDAPKRVSRSRAIKFAVTDGTLCTSALEAELIPQLNDAPRSAVTPIEEGEGEAQVGGAGAASSSSSAAAAAGGGGSGGAAARAPPHILQPGCKIVVREVLVRHGMLLLRPANCFFLGGSVQRLQDLRRHAIRELAKTRLTNKQLIKQKQPAEPAAAAGAAAAAAAPAAAPAGGAARVTAPAAGGAVRSAAASSAPLRPGTSPSAAVVSGPVAAAGRAVGVAGAGAAAAAASMSAVAGSGGVTSVAGSATLSTQRLPTNVASAAPAGPSTRAQPTAGASAAAGVDDDVDIVSARRPAPLPAASASGSAAGPSARTAATGDPCVDDSGIAPFDTGYGTGPDTDVDIDDDFDVDVLQDEADEEARQRAGSRQAAPGAAAAAAATGGSAHDRSQPASAARSRPPTASPEDDIVVIDNDEDDDEDLRGGTPARTAARGRPSGAAAQAAGSGAAGAGKAAAAAARNMSADVDADDDELMDAPQFSPRAAAPDTLPDEDGAASAARDGRVSASFDDDQAAATQADDDHGFDAPLALLPMDADADDDVAASAGAGGGVKDIDDVVRSMLRSGAMETTQTMHVSQPHPLLVVCIVCRSLALSSLLAWFRSAAVFLAGDVRLRRGRRRGWRSWRRLDGPHCMRRAGRWQRRHWQDRVTTRRGRRGAADRAHAV